MEAELNTSGELWTDQEEISEEQQRQEFMLQAKSYLTYKIGKFTHKF